MKNKLLKVIVLFTLVLSLAGCGAKDYIHDKDNKLLTNPETGQNLQREIYCKPSKNTKMYELYEEYEDQLTIPLSKLPDCEHFRITSNKTNSLWQFLFVKPIAYLVLKVGYLFKSIGSTKAYLGISLIVIGILIRIVLLPFQLKTQKQSKMMQKIQPEMQRIEKKYAGRDDQQSMIMKSQEMSNLYKKYKVNPFSSCLIALVQLPIFLGFLQAIYKIPTIYEGKIFGWSLGTTPSIGIRVDHNYTYIILIVLIAVTTFVAFKYSLSQTQSASPEAGQQSKTMLYVMTIVITFSSLSFPTAIELYWIATYLFMIIQTLITNFITKSKEQKEIMEKSGKIKEKLKLKEGMKYGKN